MKTRNISALLICALLAACGGGGGGSAPVPQQPTQTGQGTVKFTFKVPTVAKQVKRKMLRGGKYVSPATLGLGLSFSSVAVTSSQIITPNFALDLSTCVSTAFTTCVTNADGSQTFTLQAPVPVGNYNFEVVTWDHIPTSGAFTGYNQLSSAVVPLTVTLGAVTPPPSFVLNGIPASISFVPAPNQFHVASTSAGTTIIGNSAAQFFFNVIDADGFIITGQGAPTLTASDATGSFALVQNGANPNLWSATALTPAMAQSSVTLTLTATPAVGNGIATLNATPMLLPIPELWVSLNGVRGYQLTYTFGATPSVAIGSAIDNVAVSPTTSVALDPSGNLFIGEAPYQVHLLSAATYLIAPIDTGSIVNTTSTFSMIGGMAVDSNDFLYLADSGFPAGAGSLLVYNNSVPNGTLASIAFGITPGVAVGTIASGTAMTFPTSVAIAPATAAIPSSLQGTAWVSGPSGVEVFKNTGTALTDLGTAVPGGSGGLTAVSIGSDGTVWAYDAKVDLLSAYTISATFPLTLVASSAIGGSASRQMTADAIGKMWIPTTPGYVYPYQLSGCPGSCGIARGTGIYVGGSGTGIYLTP